MYKLKDDGYANLQEDHEWEEMGWSCEPDC